MDIQRNIQINNEYLTVTYTKKEYETGDSEIEVYDKYKISILLTDGLAAVIYNNVINTGKNSILFFRPDEIHFGRFFRSGIHAYINFYIPVSFFTDMFANNKMADFFEDRSKERVNYITAYNAGHKLMSSMTDKILEAVKHDSPSANAKLISAVFETISICSEKYEIQKKNPENSAIPKYVTRTLYYISENFGNKIILSELAKNVGCSVTYLSQTFKQYTGKTIYNHITETRIFNAQTMLKDGASVTDACFSSGFDDCSNFIRTFKRITGKTPLQFKHTSTEPNVV